MKTLVIINGHPDPRPERFCAALAQAYKDGAEEGGWQTTRVDIGALPAASLAALCHGHCEDNKLRSQINEIANADRLVLVYPLWCERPPQGLLDLFAYLEEVQWSPTGGRKAQLIVTMDMPAFAYRRMVAPETIEKPQMLDIPGIFPDEPVLIGCVPAISAEQRGRWLAAMHDYGKRTNCGAAIVPSRMEAFAAAVDRKVSEWWAAL